MNQGVLVLVDIALWLALAGAVRYALHPILADYRSPRAPLPRHAGQTRPARAKAAPDEGSASPVAGPEAGPVHTVPPVGPAGTGAEGRHPAPVPPQARKVTLPVETPALYNTGALPVLSQEAADEIWWML